VTVAKGPDAFRTISEAAIELGVPQHVLRFWESKFSFIRPMKRAGGRRFYRRQDIEVLRGVRVLLHDQGYTIKGVQRLHKEQGVRRLVAASTGAHDDVDMTLDAGARPVLSAESRERLNDVLYDLESTKARIDELLGRH
jgi:DNA-binding transcriptional MerR regulator